MKSFAQTDIEANGNYLKLLSSVSKLSGLFSESTVPFINYRVAENVFCRSFKADNLSRSDTAFDAKYGTVGVGLKTFVCKGSSSTEKVAEFNSLSRELSNYQGKELALKLAEYRNDRIDLAKRVYAIESAVYHIVARRDNELLLFETDYDKIDVANISSVKSNKASLQFEDGHNFYSFNYSKSTLFRKFIIPDDAYSLMVDIIADPYTLMLEQFSAGDINAPLPQESPKEAFVILPLYGMKKKQRHVFEKSGLNQWNAGGRKRDMGEIYIPIPRSIHKAHPDFFPNRDVQFKMQIPTGEEFTAKVCQEGSKALMTNPNKAMSDWLLRCILQLEEGELATIDKLDKLGFDSVVITKKSNDEYAIDIMTSKAEEPLYEQTTLVFD